MNDELTYCDGERNETSHLEHLRVSKFSVVQTQVQVSSSQDIPEIIIDQGPEWWQELPRGYTYVSNREFNHVVLVRLDPNQLMKGRGLRFLNAQRPKRFPATPWLIIEDAISERSALPLVSDAKSRKVLGYAKSRDAFLPHYPLFLIALKM